MVAELDEADEADGAEAADGVAPAEPTPTPRPVSAPRVDRRRFHRELTPTWLAAVTALHGQPCPRLSAPDLRVAHLGVGRSVTPAVVAAVHSDASVWAWDHRPVAVELASELGEAAQLTNLVVHHHPRLPDRLGAPAPTGHRSDPVDLVVVDHVLDSLDDAGRRHVLDSIEASLRPGGVVVVTYRTAVGWAEIDPMVRLLRYMVDHHGGSVLDATRHAVTQLVRLRDAGAAYMHARPAVLAWLADLADTPPARIVEDYLDADLRPLSHARLSDALGGIGCHYVASAALDEFAAPDTGGDGSGGPTAELLATVDAAPSVELRETYRDLAWRRTERADVFRLGRHHQPGGGHELRFASLVEGPNPLDGADRDRVVQLWRDGRVHPVPAVAADDRAAAAAVRLTAALANEVVDDRPGGDGARLEVVAALGTAFDVDRSEPR